MLTTSSHPTTTAGVKLRTKADPRYATLAQSRAPSFPFIDVSENHFALLHTVVSRHCPSAPELRAPFLSFSLLPSHLSPLLDLLLLLHVCLLSNVLLLDTRLKSLPRVALTSPQPSLALELQKPSLRASWLKKLLLLCLRLRSCRPGRPAATLRVLWRARPLWAQGLWLMSPSPQLLLMVRSLLPRESWLPARELIS